MMKWKEYTGNRLIMEHSEGFYVIKPKEDVNHFPLFCPLCESIMRTELDEEEFKKFSCCDSCAMNWVYPNREKWEKGWRPSVEEVMNKYNIIPI